MIKILFIVLSMISIATSASAEFTFVIPQSPGGGTSQWAQIIAIELEPFLGESIRLVHQPGARDIPGFNLWDNKLRNDPKSIMVSHGGNGVAFLQENVGYDYRRYESVGLMNLNIIVATSIGIIPGVDQIRSASGSGLVPEAMAMTLLLCGPGLTIDQYVECFKENVLWVNGMSGGERRLAFQRGELNTTRENPAAFLKHVMPRIENELARVWFHHGLLNAETGAHDDDPNYPGFQMEILYEGIWGEPPSGDFYNAYKLVKSFRDGLQKALWMDPSSQYLEKVRVALTAMTNDEAAMANIRRAVGNYEWLIGEDGNAQRDTLISFITIKALQDLVTFNSEALGLASVFKPELVE